jgi:hypothetical protein
MIAAVPVLWLVSATAGRTGPAVPDAARPQTLTHSRGHASTVAVPRVHLARLRHAHKNVDPLSARNPFAFTLRGVPPNTQPQRIVSTAPSAAPADIPTVVPLSLIGVATSRVDGRLERTAVIAGPADVLCYAREGDTVIARYRADAIEHDSVLLVDLATGSSLRLTLR